MNVIKPGHQQATAKVRLTLSLEISVNGTWGEDCTVKQVQDDAERQARNIVRRYLERDDVKVRTSQVSEPVVEVVIVTKDVR